MRPETVGIVDQIFHPILRRCSDQANGPNPFTAHGRDLMTEHMFDGR
ncbi:MAG: hypothetical protein OET79_12180 [Nitrospirota bacterium]|nr:hypothetical protein [Nitrospirota bacterium]